MKKKNKTIFMSKQLCEEPWKGYPTKAGVELRWIHEREKWNEMYINVSRGQNDL